MSHRRLVAPLLTAIFLFANPAARAQQPAKTTTPAPAQAPAADAKKAGDPPAADPDAPKIVSDLATRYRLVERYTNRLEKAPLGATGQYQVAFRETTTSDDAKVKEPRVVQAIFSERPAEVSPVDERVVTDSVRHYTSVSITPDPWKDRKDRRPLEDLTIWYRELVGEAPMVLVLSPGRPLRDEEYRFAIDYAFVTGLAFLLPEQPVRVGESWKIGRPGAVALINDLVREGSLTAKLVEIRVYPKDPKRQFAVITIAGRLVTGDSDVYDTAVNARVEFAFTPAGKGDPVVDAAGAIEKLRLGQVSTLRVAGLTKTVTKRRDLSLDLRRPGGEPILPIPKPTPQATPDNSWLTYVDPKGRYQLRHPQGFQPTFVRDLPNSIDLRYPHGVETPPDIIRLTFVDKPAGRPDDSFKLLVEDWRKRGTDVQLGLSEKLPDAEWPDLSVHHMEAALTENDPSGRPARRYYDAYVMQFPRNVSLFINATTFQDQPDAFRADVRALLKTVKLGAPKGP